MSGVGRHPDIFGIGELHGPAHVFFPFHGPPDMGMRRQPDSHGNRLPADLVEGVGESLELIVARTAGRTLAHVDLPVVAAERLEKIAGEGHMIGNGFGDLLRIDEICRLADLAIGRVDERDAGIIENLFELQRIFPVLLNAIPVRLDALQSQGGDSFDRPHGVVLLAPDGAGGPEKNVRIDGVERLMRDRAPHLGWPHDTCGGRHAGQCQSGRHKLPPLSLRSQLSQTWTLPPLEWFVVHTEIVIPLPKRSFAYSLLCGRLRDAGMHHSSTSSLTPIWDRDEPLQIGSTFPSQQERKRRVPLAVGHVCRQCAGAR